MAIASAMAKTGAMLLSAPAIFGPIKRLDSKCSSATVPEKNSPTHANSATAFRLPLLGSTKKWGETPEQQRRRWNADRHTQPGQHPPQPELGEHEAGAEPEHRREGEENRCSDGYCPT